MSPPRQDSRVPRGGCGTVVDLTLYGVRSGSDLACRTCPIDGTSDRHGSGCTARPLSSGRAVAANRRRPADLIVRVSTVVVGESGPGGISGRSAGRKPCCPRPIGGGFIGGSPGARRTGFGRSRPRRAVEARLDQLDVFYRRPALPGLDRPTRL